MAPLFQSAGLSPLFQCKFRLKAFDDGKLRCYLDTAAGTQEVAARFRGLSKEQFDSLFSCIEQLQASENQSFNTAAVSPARLQYRFQSAFDCCMEKALGRRPSRNLAEKADSRHSRSPSSPASKQPNKRSSLRLRRLDQHADLPPDPAPAPPSAVASRHECAGAQELSFQEHIVWLQCNDDRCM